MPWHYCLTRSNCAASRLVEDAENLRVLSPGWRVVEPRQFDFLGAVRGAAMMKLRHSERIARQMDAMHGDALLVDGGLALQGLLRRAGLIAALMHDPFGD